MFQEQQKCSGDSPFFSMLNPDLLLRSFNVPEPVILAPGTDPYSFLNPNPHGDNRVQTLPLLDVDPCSRSEMMFTMSADLTVSELAGGNYGEPISVSATSDSPTTSEVIVYQPVGDVAVPKIQTENTLTMNEVTVTKIQDEIMQITRCDVCKVNTNSKDALKEHMDGKKHKKNMQRLAVSPVIKQETQPLVANDNSDQESENNKKIEIDSLQNEQSVHSLFISNIPDLGTDNQKGEKKSAQVTIEPLTITVNAIPIQPSKIDAQKAENKVNSGQSMRCEVCKICCNGEKDFERHNSGKKHLKNLKNSEKTVPPPTTTPVASRAATVDNSKSTKREVGEIIDSEEDKPVWGDIFSYTCLSEKKIPESPSNITASVATPPVETMKSTKGEVVNSKEVKSVVCELCGIICPTNEDLNKHMSGKKHQKNVKKSVGHNPTPVTEKSVQDPMDEEGKVVILEKGKRKENESKASDEEGDRKRQKVVEEDGACGPCITCKVCNVGCTTILAFTTHLASPEHSAMALKQAKVGTN